MRKVMDAYYIYMMTNSAGVLYIGITNNMSLRLWQHVHDRVPGFSSRYNLDRLVFMRFFQQHVKPLQEKSNSRVGDVRRKRL